MFSRTTERTTWTGAILNLRSLRSLIMSLRLYRGWSLALRLELPLFPLRNLVAPRSFSRRPSLIHAFHSAARAQASQLRTVRVRAGVRAGRLLDAVDRTE